MSRDGSLVEGEGGEATRGSGRPSGAGRPLQALVDASSVVRGRLGRFQDGNHHNTSKYPFATHRAPPTAHRSPLVPHRSVPPTALRALGLPCIERVRWRSLPTPRYGMQTRHRSIDACCQHASRSPITLTLHANPTALAPCSVPSAPKALRLRDLLRVVCRPTAADEWIPTLGT